MRKIIILSIAVLLITKIFGFYSDNGGYARVAALGSPEITISDKTLNFDLFSKGFLAAAQFKQITNKFFINAGFYPCNLNENNIDIKNINFFLNDEIRNHNVFFKLNEENIIIINLKCNTVASEYEETNEEQVLFNSIKSSETGLIAGIGYSKKITSNIAAGIFLNDNYFFSRVDKNLEKGVEDNEAKIYEAITAYHSKTEYVFSLAYSVNKNLNFALSLGDKKSDVPFIINEIPGLILFNPSDEKIDYENLFFNRYKILFTDDILKSKIISDEKIYLKEKKESGGNNINLGVELAQENIKAVIVAGILINYNYKYNRDIKKEIDYHYFPAVITDSTYVNSQYITNSSSHNIDLSFKYFINEFFTFSNKFNYIFAGFDFNDEKRTYNIKLMQYDLIPGFSFKIFKILLPLEFLIKNFYVEEIDKSNFKRINNGIFLYGIRIGIEYETENQIYLRAGYCLKKGGTEYIEKNDENLIDEKPGTAYNPFLIKSSFGFGIGHKFDNLEVNLCFLNEEIFKIPVSNNYQNRANKVIIDINKLF